MRIDPSAVAAALRDAYAYDPETGVFTHRRRPWNGRVEAGARAGGVDSRGYRIIRVSGRPYKAHRLAWLFVHGEWPPEIDHINGDRDDNRIANLRPVTRSENQQNVWAPRRDNKLGQRGVHKLGGRSKRYIARIWKDGRRVTLGHFDTAEEAGACYLAEKAKLHISSERTSHAS